jgi:beta-lactamase class A
MRNTGSGVVRYAGALLALFSCLGFSSPSLAEEEPYDVTYLWHSDLAHVRDYRDQVGYILGPAVARKLKVVRKEGRYGVIYLRNGDRNSAAVVARRHSKVLRRAGLGEAAPTPEEAWDVLGALEPPADPLPEPEPPRARAKPPAPEIYRGAGSDIEMAVEAYIAKLRREGRMAADERTGWSVYDFTSGEKLVTINEDETFQAASLIKPFIAAAFFHKVKSGQFIYGPKSRRHMRKMIHWSDNRSTNWVIRQVGGPRAVQRILLRHYPSIFRDTKIVEYIPPGGRTYRNKASVHDYSRFLYALWKNEIPGAKEIRRLMALPGSNRLVTGARDIPRGAKVYNKTGSTAQLCGDMGIVVVKGPDGRSYPYIVVGVIEKRGRAKNYTSWIRARSRVIAGVSNIVYKGVARRHEFEPQVTATVR